MDHFLRGDGGEAFRTLLRIGAQPVVGALPLAEEGDVLNLMCGRRGQIFAPTEPTPSSFVPAGAELAGHADLLRAFGAHRPEVPLTGVWEQGGGVLEKRPKTKGVAFGLKEDPSNTISGPFVVVSSWMADFGESGWTGDEVRFWPAKGKYTTQSVTANEAQLLPPQNQEAADAVRAALGNNKRLGVPIRLLWKHKSSRAVPVSWMSSASGKGKHSAGVVTLAHYAGLKQYVGLRADGLHAFR
jgi:hypothetical protein